MWVRWIRIRNTANNLTCWNVFFVSLIYAVLSKEKPYTDTYQVIDLIYISL
jgi:hypothetical protein